MLSPHKLVVNHKRNEEKKKEKDEKSQEDGRRQRMGEKAEEDGRRQRKWRRQSKMREGKGRWEVVKKDERKAQQLKDGPKKVLCDLGKCIWSGEGGGGLPDSQIAQIWESLYFFPLTYPTSKGDVF
jgi:hypothetical protein